MAIYTYKSKEKIIDKIYKGQKRKFLDDTITIYKVNNEIYVGQKTIAYILDVFLLILVMLILLGGVVAILYFKP